MKSKRQTTLILKHNARATIDENVLSALGKWNHAQAAREKHIEFRHEGKSLVVPTGSLVAVLEGEECQLPFGSVLGSGLSPSFSSSSSGQDSTPTEVTERIGG